MFDDKWVRGLDGLGLTRGLSFRYMDDSRSPLSPIVAGRRWENGKLAFTKQWELGNYNVSGENRTKEILRETIGDHGEA